MLGKKNPAEIVLPGHPPSTALPGYKYIKGQFHHHFSWTLRAVFCQENHLHFLTYFSLLAKMSDNTEVRLIATKLRIKKYILDLYIEISRLLEEANSDSVNEHQKGVVHTELKDLYQQLEIAEPSLVLIS